jgi:hypothetical protein
MPQNLPGPLSGGPGSASVCVSFAKSQAGGSLFPTRSQVPREQASSSGSLLVLAVQSPTALAGPRGGCAHGRPPCQCAVRAPADAPSPGTPLAGPAADAGPPRSPSPSRTWPGGSAAGPQCALSLVALMAMPVRTLLTSHARCWSVGSLPGPYLACHLAAAVCASAIMLTTPATGCLRLSTRRRSHPLAPSP